MKEMTKTVWGNVFWVWGDHSWLWALLPSQREPRARAPGLERPGRDHSGHGGDITTLCPQLCPAVLLLLQLSANTALCGCHSTHTHLNGLGLCRVLSRYINVNFVKLGKSLPCKIVYLYHQYYFCYLNSRYSSSCFCTWICNWMD